MQLTDEEKERENHRENSHTNIVHARKYLFCVCIAWVVNEAEEIWTFSICLDSGSGCVRISVSSSFIFILYAVHWFWLLATSVCPDVVVHFMNLMRRCNFFFRSFLRSISVILALVRVFFFFCSVVFAVKCGGRHSHGWFPYFLFTFTYEICAICSMFCTNVWDSHRCRRFQFRKKVDAIF